MQHLKEKLTVAERTTKAEAQLKVGQNLFASKLVGRVKILWATTLLRNQCCYDIKITNLFNYIIYNIVII